MWLAHRKPGNRRVGGCLIQTPANERRTTRPKKTARRLAPSNLRCPPSPSILHTSSPNHHHHVFDHQHNPAHSNNQRTIHARTHTHTRHCRSCSTQARLPILALHSIPIEAAKSSADNAPSPIKGSTSSSSLTTAKPSSRQRIRLRFMYLTPNANDLRHQPPLELQPFRIPRKPCSPYFSSNG